MIKYLAKNVLFWFGAVFFAAGAFFLSMVVSGIYLDIQFSNDGRIINGTVQAKRIDVEYGDKNQPFNVYVIAYEFDPQTIPPQKGEGDVNESEYIALNIADNVEVEYLVTDPATHRLAENAMGWTFSIFLVLFTSIFVLIGLFLLIKTFRRATRQSRLWNKGIALKARITEYFCTNPLATEDKFYQIVYEFEGSKGEMITGKSQLHSLGWFGRTAEGDIIDIVVDPKNPNMSEWRKEME